MTLNQRRCESAVVRSSVMPSAKYSCSGSPVMLAKGNTTSMGGLADEAFGGGGAPVWSGAGEAAGGTGVAAAMAGPARATAATHR